MMIPATITASATATATRTQTDYKNPVLSQDAPDPGVLQVGKDWWMATTGGDNASGAFPLYRSSDLIHWDKTGSLFAPGQAPKWSRDSYWAPEPHKVGDGYVAYFTARDDQGMLRIGAATSPKIEGPYQDIGQPLVSNPDVGLIDPTFFKAPDGQQYVYWKEDGNGCNPQKPSRLMAQPVSADGTKLQGEAKEVLRNDVNSWEGTVVEAPEVVQHGDFYYLFYSGNCYANDTYAEGVARSKTPLGPFEKAPHPMLHSNHDWIGPGHAAFTQDGAGKDWMIYHAWDKDHVAAPPGRELLADPLAWGADQWPHVAGDSPSAGGIAPQVALTTL